MEEVKTLEFATSELNLQVKVSKYCLELTSGCKMWLFSEYETLNHWPTRRFLPDG
jgi:hypothetical protein